MSWMPRLAAAAAISGALVACSSERSCSCPAPVAGLQLDATPWAAAHMTADALRVCERGECRTVFVAGGRVLFADGRALDSDAAIDLRLQLLDTHGAPVDEVSVAAKPVRVVTSCCGGSSIGRLFVGKVDRNGALVLEQPH